MHMGVIIVIHSLLSSDIIVTVTLTTMWFGERSERSVNTVDSFVRENW